MIARTIRTSLPRRNSRTVSLTARVIVLIAALSSVVARADAEKLLSVEGEITFPKTGDIYVMITSAELFDNEYTGVQKKKIPAAKLPAGGNRVAFRFDSLPPGTYGIRGFQDVNGNGRLDMGMFGPSEPWGMSWRTKRARGFPKFDQIKFLLNNDTTAMVIELK